MTPNGTPQKCVTYSSGLHRLSHLHFEVTFLPSQFYMDRKYSNWYKAELQMISFKFLRLLHAIEQINMFCWDQIRLYCYSSVKDIHRPATLELGNTSEPEVKAAFLQKTASSFQFVQGFLDNFHLLESVNVQFLASLNICGKSEGALCICNGAQRVFKTRQKVLLTLLESTPVPANPPLTPPCDELLYSATRFRNSSSTLLEFKLSWSILVDSPPPRLLPSWSTA